jgi:tetratricopeptide (TPR) repeat protein
MEKNNRDMYVQYFMHITSFVVVAVLIVVLRGTAAVFPSDREPALDLFVRNVVNCEFDSAFRIADSFYIADNTDPTGPLLRLLIYGMRDLDYDRHIDTAGFVATYRQTIETIGLWEQRFGRSSYSMTLAGFANATHATYYLRQKRYFSAIGTGLDGLKLLHEAKAADSANMDADFFLGLYDYAKAELRKRLWMVLFWYGGDKQQGIERLRRCADSAQIAAPAARMSLADIYIEEKQYEQARITLDTLLAQYPRSRFIKWTYAKYFMATGNNSAAAGVYGELSELYAASPHGTFNSLHTRQLQIRLLCESGNHDVSRKLAKKTLDGKCGSDPWRNCEPCMEIQSLLKKGACNGAH